MVFKVTDGTKLPLASNSGIPAMYGTGDYTTGHSNQVKITASDGASNDDFGISVAIGSGKICVGADGDDDNGSASGSAYIYNLDGTGQVKITASDGTANDFFGISAAIGSGKIVVGASGDNTNTGSAYIYNLDGTGQVKITASDGATQDRFGTSAAIGSGRIVIGAHNDGDNGFESGSAYLFDLDGTQLAKIKPSDGAANDRFGGACAIGSDRIVIGAYGDDDNGSTSGSAYIFDLDGNQISKIKASDGASNDRFGYFNTVAIGSGRICVGAYLDADNGTNSGSAYIFDLDGNQLAKIKPSDGATNDYFGSGIAIGSGRICIGAYGDADNGSYSGSAYIFDLDGNQISKIKPSDGAQDDYFGLDVAIGSGKIVIGAYLDDDNGSASGSAYLFDTPDVITSYDVKDWEYGY